MEKTVKKLRSLIFTKHKHEKKKIQKETKLTDIT